MTISRIIVRSHLSVPDVYNSMMNFVVLLMHCTIYDLISINVYFYDFTQAKK